MSNATVTKWKKGDRVRVVVPEHTQEVRVPGARWTETVEATDQVHTVHRGGTDRVTVVVNEGCWWTEHKCTVSVKWVESHGGSVERA